jgi:hypothetical protein
MSRLPKATALQRVFKRTHSLANVFIEQLGWDASPDWSTRPAAVDGLAATVIQISDMHGFGVYVVETDRRPTRLQMRQVDAQLRLRSADRLEIFEAPDEWIWHWPRRTGSGTLSFEAVPTQPATIPAFLAQRLAALEFTTAEHRKGIDPVAVRNRVHGRFDASKVTKRFYQEFRSEHHDLADAIVGIPDEDRTRYATTLLNRLMFLYFLQKKEFLDDDAEYLEHVLERVQRAEGKDRFHSFFRSALLPLFFDRLNRRDQSGTDKVTEDLLGDVPYINGGLFGPTPIEQEHHGKLDVPDDAFERILAFFNRFNWHLDTRPTGNPNEINPEVIGYIFEQYINYASTGRKEKGAYYTPHDVTAYMTAQTLVPRILDDFPDLAAVFAMLRGDPDRYIQPAMLHGWDAASGDWLPIADELVECWHGDPTGWTLLDETAENADINLPGETWVETFHRRERVTALRQRIAAGDVSQVNDLITENLNGQLLLTDAIDDLQDAGEVAGLFGSVSGLAVLDPTCGSGAFLFAALEVLEDVYAHVIDAAESFGDAAETAEMLRQVRTQPSTRYFIRRHAALHNLYGTDLMPDAVETAKLRIFLSLAACVATRADLQPLPDLDFNLKTGNLVVGFKDADDVERFDGDLLAKLKLEGLKPKVDAFGRLYVRFVRADEAGSQEQPELKRQLQEATKHLRAEADRVYADLDGITPDGIADWVCRVRPFHWFCEFPGVMERGGFDVVIGNPPYVSMSAVTDYRVTGYRTAKCPDLYAVCYERSLSLLSATGRHAFITMASMSIGHNYAELRMEISRQQREEWWSTYGRIPAGLFPSNVRVRNTILVLGPGSGVYSTRHHLHKAIQRSWLFPTIEYHTISRTGDQWPIRAGVASKFFEIYRAAATARGEGRK